MYEYLVIYCMYGGEIYEDGVCVPADRVLGTLDIRYTGYNTRIFVYPSVK